MEKRHIRSLTFPAKVPYDTTVLKEQLFDLVLAGAYISISMDATAKVITVNLKQRPASI